jgi:hypothetical protein
MGRTGFRGRARTIFFVLAIAAVAVLSPVLAITSDLVRLGPTQVDLGPNPVLLTVAVERSPASDPHPEYDWYSLRFSVQNNARENELHPYSLEVVARFPGALGASWIPANGHDFTWAVRTEEGPPGYASFSGHEVRVPAGHFRPNWDFNTSRPGGILLQWSAIGEMGSDRVPIFEDAVDFLIYQIRVPEGESVEAKIVVTLAWGYYGSLQAYPVETRTVSESIPLT